MSRRWRQDSGSGGAAAASSSSAGGGGSGKAWTALQVEAQLVYAEATLLSSLLFLFEESVVGLLKCGMAVRSGWRLYQQVDKHLGNFSIKVDRLSRSDFLSSLGCFKSQLDWLCTDSLL